MTVIATRHGQRKGCHRSLSEKRGAHHTAARLDNGELIEIIPRELSLKAGDTLTVVNHDVADHFVSVTQVPAGQTVTYEFPSPGVFDGACTVHPRGSVRIDVT